MTQQMKARPGGFSSVIAGMLFVLAAVGACSGDPEMVLFPQVSDSAQLITVDTLFSTTYKETKEYSVEGLPGATYVSYGFLRLADGNSYEYEVRFYGSHEQAVDLGTALAIEGSGETAILNVTDATYKEGVRNRRTATGRGRSGIRPRFESYAIFGNIVMLCEGADKVQSIERCGLLANVLVPNE